MSDYIVPLGFAAIGTVIAMKMYNGCGCAKKAPASKYSSKPPQYWRNHVGSETAVAHEQNRDDGTAKLSSYVLLTHDGIKLPTGLVRGPYLHPGMTNPANGKHYELQQHLNVARQISHAPAPPRKKGYKPRTDYKPMIV